VKFLLNFIGFFLLEVVVINKNYGGVALLVRAMES